MRRQNALASTRQLASVSQVQRGVGGLFYVVLEGLHLAFSVEGEQANIVFL